MRVLTDIRRHCMGQRIQETMLSCGGPGVGWGYEQECLRGNLQPIQYHTQCRQATHIPRPQTAPEGPVRAEMK